VGLWANAISLEKENALTKLGRSHTQGERDTYSIGHTHDIITGGGQSQVFLGGSSVAPIGNSITPSLPAL